MSKQIVMVVLAVVAGNWVYDSFIRGRLTAG